jgi:Xaa-Pro aminopeptidase
MQKQKIIKEMLQREQLDALLFFSPENRFWLTDFQSSLGYLLATQEENYLLVDGRYITDAQNIVKDCLIQT